MAKKAAVSSLKSRIFKKMEIKNDKVKITFIDRIKLDELEESGEEKKSENKYTVETDNKPHNDYINAVKKLVKFVGTICEFEDAEKTVTITGLEVVGSMEMKNARAILYASKETKNLKKFKIKSPDTSLFSEEDFADCKELASAVKLVISETLKYLEGKHLGDSQLALFEKR